MEPGGWKMSALSRVLGPRQLLERRNAFGNAMPRLLVASIDRHVRRSVGLWIVQRARLQDHRRKAWGPRDDMGSTVRAELARHGTLDVLARELLWRSLRVPETGNRHGHEHVGRASRDVLAFTAMTLRLHHRLAFRLVAHILAVAATLDLHRSLSELPVVQPTGGRA
jgi:hypothetical protein